MKRQLSLEKTPAEVTKKRGKISCLENLSNELIYEIFDYLEGCQLYEAFSNLNSRFETLLHASYLQLKISLCSKPQDRRNDQLTNIIIPNRHQIISLEFSDNPFDDTDSPLFTFDSSFHRLQSLIFDNIKSNDILPFLTSLLSLPQLLSLSIDFHDYPEEITNIYELIFNLPVLIYSRISLPTFWLLESESNLALSLANGEQFSHIKYFNINHVVSLDELIVILSYTPELAYLKCIRVNDSNENMTNKSLNAIWTLTQVVINRCWASFDDFQYFLTKITPKLEILRLETFDDATYLDAVRWEKIIIQNLVDLRTFEFNHIETIDDDFEKTIHHESIDRFNGNFWTKRNWIFRIRIDVNDNWFGENVLIYSISSLKSPLESLSSKNQLIFIEICDDGAYPSNLDLVGPILTAIQIFTLQIKSIKIFIGDLLRLIQYLPNLTNLVISSLAMMYPRCLSVEEAGILRRISTTNKILHLELHHVKNLAEVQFLLQLCPSTECFEINCTNADLLINIVRFILMKDSRFLPNLSTLCFDIPQTNEVVNNLQRMIDFEQLCRHYTIKKIQDKIYLKDFRL